MVHVVLLAIVCAVSTLTSSVVAQPPATFNPLNGGCIATATDDDQCFFYAYDTYKQSSGFGYLFYNPHVCDSPTTSNLVGCSPSLNFTQYSNYYYSRGVGSDATLIPYFRNLAQSVLDVISPATFAPHYCVTNCMFCKLIDSNHINLDPFCPAKVCEHYGLDAERCLPAVADGAKAGIAVRTLGPIIDTTLELDTEYDITFSVYGVSNDFPYVGMPLSQSVEGCPRDLTIRGLDAVPTGFNFQPNYNWLKANLNKITILLADGRAVHPDCATILPNGGAYERVVVFCGRDLGSPENPPTNIYIQGPVMMSNNQLTTTTVMSSKIGSLNIGTTMLYAERILNTHVDFPLFVNYNAGVRKDPCPTNTLQIISTTWTKGTRQTHPGLVTYPSFNVWSNQHTGVTVELQDGTIITGTDPLFLGLADDDNDNYVHVCLNTLVPATKVTFARGLFFDPRNTMNEQQTAIVQDLLPLHAAYPTVTANAITTPADVVTIAPSQMPTVSPTVRPSRKPTSPPTVQPTMEPSMEPSMSPTRKTHGTSVDYKAAIIVPVIFGSFQFFVIVGLLFVIYRNRYGWNGVPQDAENAHAGKSTALEMTEA